MTINDNSKRIFCLGWKNALAHWQPKQNEIDFNNKQNIDQQ
jgi:hypothetical protein